MKTDPETTLVVPEATRVRKHRIRRSFVALLILLSSIFVAVSTVAAWGHWLVLDTDHFVNTMAPIPSDPTVANALSIRITNDAFDALEVEDRIADRLPPRLAFLAGPVADGVHGFVQTRVQKVIQSERFQALWEAAVRRSHAVAVAVLKAQTKVVSTTGGVVSLDLIPFVNEALKAVEGRASQILGHPVDLPTFTGGELPSEARARLEQALGTTLPTDFGTIVVFRSTAIEQGQKAIRFFDRVVITLPILTLILIGLALLLSVNRRRTGLQLLVGSLVALVVVRVLLRRVTDDISNLGQTPQRQDGLHIIASQIFHGLFSATALILVVLFLSIATLLVTGPYKWAVALRGRTADVWQAVTTTDREAAAGATVTWLRAHHDPMQIGGAIAAVVLLLFFDVSWPGFLAIGGLLVLYELALSRIGGVEQVA